MADNEHSGFGRYANKSKGYQEERAAVEEWVEERGALLLVGITVALFVGLLLSMFHFPA